jgi:hypothetical protein
MTRKWIWLASAGLVFTLALLAASPIVHGHDDEGTKAGDHCAVCHLRHVSVLAPPAAPAQGTPSVLEHPSVPDVAAGEREAYRQLQLSRGPPV